MELYMLGNLLDIDKIKLDSVCYQERLSSVFLRHVGFHYKQTFRTRLAKYNMLVVHQLPYSPDLIQGDFYLFLKMKTALKGQRFQVVDEIKQCDGAQGISKNDF